MNRFDMVDLLRWRSELPYWKLIAHIVGSLVTLVPATVLGYLVDGLMFAMNALVSARNEIWKWSGFTPRVMSDDELSVEARTYWMAATARLCAHCKQETDESLRIHVKCLREMFGGWHCPDEHGAVPVVSELATVADDGVSLCPACKAADEAWWAASPKWCPSCVEKQGKVTEFPDSGTLQG